MTRFLQTVAVAVVGAVLLAGCGILAKSVEIRDVRVSDDGTTLTLHVDACEAEYSFEVQETVESVAVWFSAVNGSDAGCFDEYVIELTAPIGDRTFIDGHDFTQVDVEGRDS